MSQTAVRKTYYSTSDLSTLVGRIGEFTVDITRKTLIIFDGTTSGGIPLALASHTHDPASGSVTGFMSAADWTQLYNHTHSNASQSVAGFMSAADKLKLDGVSAGGGAVTPFSSVNTPNTLAYRDVNGDFAARKITATDFIGHLQGNADTVTNGVYTSGTYSNPSWLTSIDGSKITGTISADMVTSLPWSLLTGTIPNISIFPNNSNYITNTGNTTGTSGGVLSTGGRETANATANTVILRDSSGRAKIVTPIASTDIANKVYVDGAVGGGSQRMTNYTAIYTSTQPALLPASSITPVNISGIGVVRYIRMMPWYLPLSNYTNLVYYDFILDGVTSTWKHSDLFSYGNTEPMYDNGGRSSPALLLDLGLTFTTTCVITARWTQIDTNWPSSPLPAITVNVMLFLKN